MGKRIVRNWPENTIKLSEVTDNDFIMIRSKGGKPLGMILRDRNSLYSTKFKDNFGGYSSNKLHDLITILIDNGYLLTIEE